MRWWLLCVVGCAPWSDADLDGDGVATHAGDCDDGDPSVHPGAPEASGDGIDQDCDGYDGLPPCPWAGEWAPERVYCSQDGRLSDATAAWEEAIGRVELVLHEVDAGCSAVLTAERPTCSERQEWSIEPTALDRGSVSFLEVQCEGEGCDCALDEATAEVPIQSLTDGLRMGPIALPRAPCSVVIDLVPL